MPESWDCNPMEAIKSTTGWGNNIVASFADSSRSDSFMYKAGAPPNRNENLQAVCGKLSGISGSSMIMNIVTNVLDMS